MRYIINKTIKKIIIITLLLSIMITVVMPITVNAANTNNTNTFTYEYDTLDGVMPHILFTPTNIDESKDIPLIVWLHGDGEVFKSRDTLLASGFPNILKNWSYKGFNAYVLCPQISSGWCTNSNWQDDTVKNNLKNLLDKCIAEYNIDTSRIVLAGHSGGGKGALAIAAKLPQYFSKLVVLSGVNTGLESQIQIPTICFVGDSDKNKAYIENLSNVFGAENTFTVASNHGNVPSVVFSQDTGECIRNSRKWTIRYIRLDV